MSSMIFQSRVLSDFAQPQRPDFNIIHTEVFSNPACTPNRERASKLADLTVREVDVVRLLAQAMPNKKIARSLGLSPETVKWHLKNIYNKLGLTTRDEVAALCWQNVQFNDRSV
ncbi:MAG: hypothetical protein C4K60_19070 [Ideonella sp. MAG2]|nr:MAG: hypothetical protein C4K60_19070 [Ideonella sp. MAG2]